MSKKLIAFLLVSGILRSPESFCSEDMSGWHIAVGPQFAHINDYGPVLGATLSLKYEHHNGFGGMAAFSYMTDVFVPDDCEYCCYDPCYRPHCYRHHDRRCSEITSVDDRNASYFSYLIGPTYRISDSISIFGLGGYARSKMSMLSDNLRYGNEDAENDIESRYLVYRVGLNVNMENHTSFSIGYEGSMAAFSVKDHAISSFFSNCEYHF